MMLGSCSERHINKALELAGHGSALQGSRCQWGYQGRTSLFLTPLTYLLSPAICHLRQVSPVKMWEGMSVCEKTGPPLPFLGAI